MCALNRALLMALIALVLSGIPAGAGAQEAHTEEHDSTATGLRVS